MNKKLIFKIIYVITFCMLISAMVFSSSAVNVNNGYYDGLFSFIGNMHAMDIDAESLKGAALNGAMEGMSDYSCFTLAENPDTKSAYGLGAALEKNRQGFVVVSVSPASPAHKAEIKSGDIIISVDKYKTSTMGIESFSSYVSARESVLLEIYNTQLGYTNAVRVEKGVGFDRDVDYSLLDRAGYLRINRFTDETASIVQNYIEIIEKSLRKNLIIDLRNLVSMDVENACKIAMLISDNGMIARTGSKTYAVPEKETSLNVIAIINNQTKGAGEIIAGAPGVKTYGDVSGGEAVYISYYPVFSEFGYAQYKKETKQEDLTKILNYIKFMKPDISENYITGYIGIVESGVYNSKGKLISKQNPVVPDVFVENSEIGYMNYEPGENMINIRRDYSEGGVNYDIYMAKKILAHLGFYNGPMDVVFESEMIKAVNQYKIENGKAADGILDTDTQAMLNTYTLKIELEKDECIKAALGDMQF